MVSKSLLWHYTQLLQEYGDPITYWPQWCAKTKSVKEREKIIIGMVLVQRTSWHNANIALKNLKKENLLSIRKISELKSLDKLTQLIRSAGFYQSKPKRLFDICAFAIGQGGISRLIKRDASKLRLDLLDIKGVGQETADTILLYALDKPVFIIDEYARRWVEKNGITKEKDYLKLQQFFHDNLKKDLLIYQNFHTLIIVCQRGREKSVMEVV
ncbi:endonuclease III domain-containing protein [Patescibacteria group bacterium]